MNINIPNSVTLLHHLESHTEEETAAMLGISKNAVYQMWKHKRDVRLRDIDGKLYWSEIKPWRNGDHRLDNGLPETRAPRKRKSCKRS